MNANPYFKRIYQKYIQLTTLNDFRNDLRDKVIESSKAEGITEQQKLCIEDEIGLSCGLIRDITLAMSYFLPEVESSNATIQHSAIQPLLDKISKKMDALQPDMILASAIDDDGTEFSKDARLCILHQVPLESASAAAKTEPPSPSARNVNSSSGSTTNTLSITSILSGEYEKKKMQDIERQLAYNESKYFAEKIVMPSNNTSSFDATLKELSKQVDNLSTIPYREQVDMESEDGYSDMEDEEAEKQDDEETIKRNILGIVSSEQQSSAPLSNDEKVVGGRGWRTKHTLDAIRSFHVLEKPNFLVASPQGSLQKAMWISLSQVCASANTTPPIFPSALKDLKNVADQDRMTTAWLAQIADMVRYDILCVVVLGNNRRRDYGGVCSCTTRNKCVAVFVEEDKKYRPVSFKVGGQHIFCITNDNISPSVQFFAEANQMRTTKS